MTQISKKNNMNPKIRIKDLPEEERKLITAIIRTYIQTTGMAQQTGLGLEKCEETVSAMIDAGKLVIVYNEETDCIQIKRVRKKL